MRRPTLSLQAAIAVLLSPVVLLSWGCSKGSCGCPLSSTCPQKQACEWTPLFNGKDLTGWQPEGGAVWKVENGQMIGMQGPNYAPGDLFTTQDYSDFEVKVTYKVVWPANGGIWFRYQNPEVAYQADILEYTNPVAYSGTIYCPGRMFLSSNPDPDTVNRTGWNTMRIRAKGDHLQIWLNDVQVGETHDNAIKHGKIGFQIHPGNEFGPMRFIVREAKLKAL